MPASLTFARIGQSLTVAALWTTAALATEKAPFKTYYWEADRLREVKRLLTEDSADDEVAQAAERLRREAAVALKRRPRSVMEKDSIPPSGDKHDYISYAVYWWPDPTKSDGKPYIRRDGYTNHVQRSKGDRDRLKSTLEDIETLAIAHFLLGDDDHGRHARKLVRAWFIEEQTRMNPHLKYAQAVVGESDGRGSGIIDTRAFIELLDAVALLNHTGALSSKDCQALDEWFAEYYRWLLTSKHGRDERAADNNHGTWYSAQAVRIAIHLDDLETARSLIEEAREKRLVAAIEADGSQPEELSRTRSLHYSLFNLSAFTYLARLSESQKIDLWTHNSQGRGSIRQGLLFVAPYLLNQGRWKYEQISDYSLSPQIVQLFAMAATRYNEPIFNEVLERAPQSDPNRQITPLLFALPDN